MSDCFETSYLDSWSDFKSHLIHYGYSKFVGYGQNDGILYRGQADPNWPLKASFDRLHGALPSEERNKLAAATLRRFVESCKVQGLISGDLDELGVEILAQHHGLPTRCLDWSSSVYIASFFAFSDIATRTTDHVAIWTLNLALLSEIADRWPICVTDIGIRRNVRIMNQFGYVTLVTAEEGPFELIEGIRMHGQHLPGVLRRICIPSRFAAEALIDLRAMGISHYALFGTVDAIAKDIAMESIYVQSDELSRSV